MKKQIAGQNCRNCRKWGTSICNAWKYEKVRPLSSDWCNGWKKIKEEKSGDITRKTNTIAN